jgi:large subunit ribosomal protein L21
MFTRRLSTALIRPALSIVRHPFPLPTAPTAENTPLKFAIFECLGHQYKVTVDDVIVADRMEHVDIGDVVNLDKVLMIGMRESTLIGRPYINGAKVIATVEEKAKDKKVIAFKMRRRKNSRRTKGFRRQLTILRITDIVHE